MSIMKKTIITLIATLMALAASHEAKAQIVYAPFIPEKSSSSESGSGYYQGGRSYGSSRPAVQTQRARTTAYCLLGSDRYGKLPIVVEFSQSGAYVVQVFNAPQSMVYGASEGRWVNIYPTVIQSCYPDLSSHPLEKSFMYKANIDGTMYYFDL